MFAERLEPDLTAAYARRTGRLKTIVHHLGLALGGRPAESFARGLMVPASRDTMLRTVHRRAPRPAESLNVVGIDGWVFRRRRYGTLICDWSGGGSSPDCRIARAVASRQWLSAHPEIAILAGDRGGCYGEATTWVCFGVQL